MDVALGSHLAKGRRGVKHGCFEADFFTANPPRGGYRPYLAVRDA